jgi:hypothetical protein
MYKPQGNIQISHILPWMREIKNTRPSKCLFIDIMIIPKSSQVSSNDALRAALNSVAHEEETCLSVFKVVIDSI